MDYAAVKILVVIKAFLSGQVEIVGITLVRRVGQVFCPLVIENVSHHDSLSPYGFYVLKLCSRILSEVINTLE